MRVLSTERLVLRELTAGDAEFMLALLNDRSFLKYIGDKGVRSIADARRYILEGPVASYERFGHGLYLVERKGSGEPMGICGLVNRAELEDVDIGFAFLPRYWSRGYALEAASAVLQHAHEVLEIRRVVAIANPGNERSFRLLEKLGLRFERMIQLAEDQPEVKLFVPAD